ncbi:MAG: hypothetical protein ACFCBU_07915 [Cyanophyceae cyanobacterium]
MSRLDSKGNKNKQLLIRLGFLNALIGEVDSADAMTIDKVIELFSQSLTQGFLSHKDVCSIFGKVVHRASSANPFALGEFVVSVLRKPLSTEKKRLENEIKFNDQEIA